MTAQPPGARRLEAYAPPDSLRIVQRRAFMIGIAALALAGVGALLDPAQFIRSYLVAFLYWLGIPLGCFGILMLHHVSGGAWGLLIRRTLEAASRTLPILALAFMPLLFGLKVLYHWARPDEVAADHLMQHQAPYLNPTFFTIRTVIYFVLWCGFAALLSSMSRRQDQDPSASIARRLQLISAAGLGLYCLSGTFAAIDWLMSLDSHWYSTIYGFYFVGGQVVSALSFVILVALFLSGSEPMARVFKPIHFHDYGKLLLAFVVLWAYFAASQLIIMWQGNLAEEVVWYRGRLLGGWLWVSILLVAMHFALPFLLLLSRDLKRNVKRLSWIALLLLVMRWVDLYWLAAPAFSPNGVSLHWLDLATTIGLGGIWVGMYAAELRKRPLLPLGDPDLAEALGDV